ncbi:MAG: T9SS type A sorting domain-containing protein [Bacteroidetes bacterium]|nr:T9SS type A sorting domain-containing protein [Bacteroidota bacterium]
MAMFLFLPIAASLHAQTGLEKATDLPDWHVQLWENVIRTDIWYFGHYSAPLGDIDGDGFDDFAVSSQADTTFIFLGGDPFNHQEAFIIRGGSAGIASADFNRDGKLDLVTAINNWYPGEVPPEYRGAVRVYLQKDGPEYFVWEPDLLIEGEVNEQVGKNVTSAVRSPLLTIDFNGDGWPDMLTTAADTRDSVKWKAVLFLGGPEMDDRYDAEFLHGPPVSINDSYVTDILAGDLNGDGYVDVLISGTIPKFQGIKYWDVYLGNPWAIAREPQRVIRADQGWAPWIGVAAIMDADGDGYADILDVGQHKKLGDALLFRGQAILPEIILPNDSIFNLNPDPMLDLSPQIVSPVGDMNGDGLPDLVLAWNKALAPGGSAYYFYPGGPLFRKPLGFFGTLPENDNVQPGVYPVGDVNGDGYDDIITLGKGNSESSTTCRFQIWLGARQLSTTLDRLPTAQSLSFDVAPQPLSPDSRQLHVVCHGLQPGSADLELTDLLGRTVLLQSNETGGDTMTTTLDLNALPAGVYLLSLRQQSLSITRTIIVH